MRFIVGDSELGKMLLESPELRFSNRWKHKSCRLLNIGRDYEFRREILDEIRQEKTVIDGSGSINIEPRDGSKGELSKEWKKEWCEAKRGISFPGSRALYSIVNIQSACQH